LHIQLFKGDHLSKLKKVTIYTDGGCIGNPGPGGYGVVMLCEGHRKELSGGFRLTTNNRMETLAAIVALESLTTPCEVTLYSDSKYLVDAMMQGWAARWRANGWYRNKKEKALNPDLWERLLELSKRHEVEFVWVKGHAGNKENERCDVLCKMAAYQSDLPVDLNYEKNLNL
jgi:ribonuclease HI